MASDLAVSAGTILGAYFLLPSNVRFDTVGGINYLDTPLSAIKATWQSNTVRDYLPSVGVMAGGMLVKCALRWISSGHAAREARERLARGEVVFEALPLMGHHGLMMGWRLRL